MEDAGLTGKVIVTGGDCETAALQRIAAGTQAMSIYKDYAKFCELALDTAVSLYNGENVDLEVYYGVPSVKCEYSTIDSTNLDQEFIDSGKRTHEEIYGQ